MWVSLPLWVSERILEKVHISIVSMVGRKRVQNNKIISRVFCLSLFPPTYYPTSKQIAGRGLADPAHFLSKYIFSRFIVSGICNRTQNNHCLILSLCILLFAPTYTTYNPTSKQITRCSVWLVCGLADPTHLRSKHKSSLFLLSVVCKLAQNNHCLILFLRGLFVTTYSSTVFPSPEMWVCCHAHFTLQHKFPASFVLPDYLPQGFRKASRRIQTWRFGFIVFEHFAHRPIEQQLGAAWRNALID